MTDAARALGRRLALVPPTLVGVSLVTFALIHLAPGDAASLRAGQGRGVTPEVIAEDRALAGLDRPLGARYLAWLGRSATLDFGVSPVDGRPVRARVVEALPATLELGALAALIAIVFALALGTWSALRDGTPAARRLHLALALVYGVPAMVVALVLVWAGAPLVDPARDAAGGASRFAALWAPAACLALPSLAMLARQQRGALARVLATDYLRTARAVGASPTRALLGHALKNALLPLVTLGGTLVPALLSGSVLVERIFDIHGLGMLGYEALLGRDYPTLMALTTLGAALTIAAMLIAEGAALLVDPRLRTQGARGRGL